MCEYVYMFVTKDKYELPLIVADTIDELSEKCGVRKSAISCGIHQEKKYGKSSRYKKVKIS